MRLPALARTWWGEVDSKSSATIDRVITEHCSSIVSAVEMKDVLRHQEKAVENMAVRPKFSQLARKNARFPNFKPRKFDWFYRLSEVIDFIAVP